MTDADLINNALEELQGLKLCPREKYLEGFVIRVAKVYPVYDEFYQKHLNKIKEYGLGISYYYKAQKILKESDKSSSNILQKAKQIAKKFYKKSLDQLSQLRENDFGYEFSKALANNVAFRMEVLK